MNFRVKSCKLSLNHFHISELVETFYTCVFSMTMHYRAVMDADFLLWLSHLEKNISFIINLIWDNSQCHNLGHTVMFTITLLVVTVSLSWSWSVMEAFSTTCETKHGHFVMDCRGLSWLLCHSQAKKLTITSFDRV